MDHVEGKITANRSEIGDVTGDDGRADVAGRERDQDVERCGIGSWAARV